MFSGRFACPLVNRDSPVGGRSLVLHLLASWLLWVSVDVGFVCGSRRSLQAGSGARPPNTPLPFTGTVCFPAPRVPGFVCVFLTTVLESPPFPGAPAPFTGGRHADSGPGSGRAGPGPPATAHVHLVSGAICPCACVPGGVASRRVASARSAPRARPSPSRPVSSCRVSRGEPGSRHGRVCPALVCTLGAAWARPAPVLCARGSWRWPKRFRGTSGHPRRPRPRARRSFAAVKFTD